MSLDTEMTEPPARPRVLLAGDSIASGLGVYGQSFGKLASDGLEASAVLDLTGISVSVGETLEQAEAIRAFAPELAILGCGTTESLVHPGEVVKRAIERFGPKSVRGVAGLEPRAYLSGGVGRRLRQRISSALKVMVKRTIIALTGGGRRLPVEQFRADLGRMVALLEQLDCPMIFIGMSPVDESLFPGTGVALADTQAVLDSLLAGRRDVELVDPRTSLRYWDDFLRDRLHLNDAGHARLAAEVLVAAQRLGVEQPALESAA